VKRVFDFMLVRILPNFYFSKFLSDVLLKHIKPKNYIDLWSTQPFNGQIQRAKQIRILAEEFKPSICIETGTYFGTSTPHLASLVSGKTFTIEIDPRVFQETELRLTQNFPMFDITCILGDSATELEKILENLDPGSEKVLAYLDAHWQDALPLESELRALAKWGGDWIAIVDDFMVPGDGGYGYDSYGSELISKDQVPSDFDLEVFVPVNPSLLESGASRGTAYILGKNLRSQLDVNAFSELKII
jgi:predicted O-methyltransferase YrrM